MSQGLSAFPVRTAFGASSKVPDRTAYGAGGTQQAFTQSTYGRRPDQTYSYPPATAAPQAGPPQYGGRPGVEKEPNSLSELAEEQREELNEAFQLFDLDRDKHLDYHELRVALRALGFKIPRTELAQLVHAHGTVRQGATRIRDAAGKEVQTWHISQLQISHASFLRIAAQKVLEREPTEEVERAFHLFDVGQKGYIVMDDLRRAAHSLGEAGLEEEELIAMLEEYDYDGTGYVTREAFFAICLQ